MAKALIEGSDGMHLQLLSPLFEKENASDCLNLSIYGRRLRLFLEYLDLPGEGGSLEVNDRTNSLELKRHGLKMLNLQRP